jgi:pyridoxal phosphate enzyme (YggS family)
MSIGDNLIKIKNTLPTQVTLVAVSKTKPNTMLMEAYEVGQRDFGENYVQELVDKQAQLPKDIRWHFIGHLQSNKVKFIAPFVHLIHGVDSLRLLEEINKQGAKNNRVINCLLQVHIANEETKFGFDVAEILNLDLIDLSQKYKHVRIVGIMGMASNTQNSLTVETDFATLKTLYDNLKKKNPQDITILSGGMSGDYEIAIKYSSNMVRIGSTIFGERDYSS